MCSSKFRKIHKETPVLESLLIKLEAESCIFVKKETLAQVISSEFCEISMNFFSTEHLQTTASGVSCFFSYTKYIKAKFGDHP